MKRLTALWPNGDEANLRVQEKPFAPPAQVREIKRECRERIDVFGAGGGFVFDAVHNVQATTPTENMPAMFKAIKDSGQ